MTKRTLAAAILAALPLATGALRADCIRPADAAEARGIAGHDARPQWAYILGGGARMVIACPLNGWSCLLHAL